MQAFKAERGESIVKGALTLAGSDARIGTIGWCFGGGLSLQAALTAGSQVVGCVMYYGMPEENVEKLKTLNTDVLNIWPTKDQWINKNVMDKFENNMQSAGKELTVKAYDAGHGFANPSNPAAYNEVATRDANKHVLEYFKSKF
jgi:carboxymethylenebutenolidase